MPWATRLLARAGGSVISSSAELAAYLGEDGVVRMGSFTAGKEVWRRLAWQFSTCEWLSSVPPPRNFFEFARRFCARVFA